MKETSELLNGMHAAYSDAVFTVQLANPETEITITAHAPSLDNALGFVCDCCGCDTLLPSHWQERDSRWVMKVFDWDECGAPQFPSALARIIAPLGFVPPASPRGSMV